MNATSTLSNNSICRLDAEPPAPTVLEAIGGNQLYPIPSSGARPWVFTLEVKYPDMKDDHRIDVTLVGEGLEDFPLPEKWGDSAKGFVHFDLTEAIIGRYVDSDAYISYTVTSGPVSVASQTLALTVQRILDKDLPMPEMPQAVGHVLDLREIRGPIRCHLGALPYAAVGMRLWFDIEGLDVDANPIVYHVIQGRALTAQEVTEGITEVIDRDFLHLFDDYSGMTLIYYLSYKGAADKNVATELRRDTYQIRQIQQLRLETEDFDAAPSQCITIGSSVTVNKITVELLPGSHGTAAIEGFGSVHPGMRVGQCIAMCRGIHSDVDQQKFLITFAEPLTRLKFAITWVHFYLRCELFDEQQNMIDDLELTGWSNVWADFSSDAGIKTMVVHARDYSFLDFFSMWVKP
ncbi:hypothetical protein ICY20_13095 [Pseudomonas sp. P115]|uniref:hypothetical protein n=1 Tax=Pseudomonas pisciculturae TaxID=2730413 RepID=UPI001892583F|nr:hypothetical protein [Pseudomonas pisciculturae]MBF6028673.1 hypothetical protein [Pseudomonas pisciculturae]